MTKAAAYFSLPEVSNSDLKELRRLYNVAALRDLAKVFGFGSLVDALLTERWKVDFTRCTLNDDGREISFASADFALALRLVEYLQADPLIRLFLDTMVGQYIFRRTLKFTYEGDEYQIRGRCKFDLFSRVHRFGLDFKTTACTTLKSFRESIEFLDYDQAAAWYMDLAKIDRFWIIGISKKTGEIFKYAIERGDETYERGRAKYALWAYRWICLIEPQNLFKL
jgi:hypothetical protein